MRDCFILNCNKMDAGIYCCNYVSCICSVWEEHFVIVIEQKDNKIDHQLLIRLTSPVKSQVPSCWHSCSMQYGLLQFGPSKPSMQVHVKLSPVLGSEIKTTNFSWTHWFHSSQTMQAQQIKLHFCIPCNIWYLNLDLGTKMNLFFFNLFTSMLVAF